MKKVSKFLVAALMGVGAVACSSPEKMAEMAENVVVKCDPAVLEVVGGEIVAKVTVDYPSEYFHPQAILEVTPVIVYEGGEEKMKPFTFQGEKVKDNYEVITKDGKSVTKNVKFTYKPGMEKSHLELRGVVRYKSKYVNLPVKKAADGANTTYMLADQGGKVDYKADGYLDIINQTEEGQILYAINSANVRNKELKSQSIKDFQAALDEIKANERKKLVSTDIVAYASPDGKEDLNAKLSDNRSNSAQKAFKTVTKKHEVSGPVNVQSVGEDWEGFQELVAASNIEDKDLIIRVLSMYSDPAVREQEIKNMSAVYTTLAKEVLPELRRARFIANVEFTNYTSEELLQLVEDNIDVLDETALLRSAVLVKDTKDKVALYKKAIEKFQSNTAQYNLAVLYIENNDLKKAEKELAKAEQDADYNNAMGVIALRKGDQAEAVRFFNAAANQTAKENLALVDIFNGDYKAAADKLAGTKTFNEALAQLLIGNNNAALALDCECPRVEYLKAVASARMGKASDVKKHLELASENKAFAARATKDIEFAQFR